MNRLLPFAHMVNRTIQGDLGDRLNGKCKTLFDGKEYDIANKKETVPNFLNCAQTSNSRDNDQDAELRAITAIVFSCEYGVMEHRGVSRVIQAGLFSFLKVVIAADKKFSNTFFKSAQDWNRRLLHTQGSYMMTGRMLASGETSVGTQVIAPFL